MKFLKKSILLLLLLTSIGVQAQIKFQIEPSVNFGLITSSSATSTKEVNPDRPNLKKYQTDANKAEYGNMPGAGVHGSINILFHMASKPIQSLTHNFNIAREYNGTIDKEI